VDNRPWGRTWGNRATYVHPYTAERFRAQRGFERRELPRDAGHRAGTPAFRGPEHRDQPGRSQGMQQHQPTDHRWGAAQQQHHEAPQQHHDAPKHK